LNVWDLSPAQFRMVSRSRSASQVPADSGGTRAVVSKILRRRQPGALHVDLQSG
jgi:hypothetical protein